MLEDNWEHWLVLCFLSGSGACRWRWIWSLWSRWWCVWNSACFTVRISKIYIKSYLILIHPSTHCRSMFHRLGCTVPLLDTVHYGYFQIWSIHFGRLLGLLPTINRVCLVKKKLLVWAVQSLQNKHFTPKEAFGFLFPSLPVVLPWNSPLPHDWPAAHC